MKNEFGKLIGKNSLFPIFVGKKEKNLHLLNKLSSTNGKNKPNSAWRLCPNDVRLA